MYKLTILSIVYSSYTTLYNIALLVPFIHDWKRNHICQTCLLVGRPADKGFHLNANQKGNKSIIVILEKDCSVCLLCHISDLILTQGVFTTSLSGQGDATV